MDQTSDESSPIPKIKRAPVSKYPNLTNGFVISSLDPAPILKRDQEIGMLWKPVEHYIKMYMIDIILQFDVADFQFNQSTTTQVLNAIRETLMKRLAYDGVTTGHISVPFSQKHHSLVLTAPGHKTSPAVLRQEVFSLIALELPPGYAAPKR